MERIEEDPVETQDGGDKVFRHPAYAQIGASRVSGHRTLYGSDFVHHNYVSVRIKRSTLRRGLSHDWHHGGEELIEVEMSEAQWATFVSSMNMGDGTPCTISRWEKRLVPGIPRRTQDDAFKNEVRQRLDKTIGMLRRLRERVGVDTNGLSKARREMLLGPIDTALAELTSNLPFVADSFDEHVETKIEAAKVELHGYMNAVLQRAGLEALEARQQPVMLIGEEESDEHS